MPDPTSDQFVAPAGGSNPPGLPGETPSLLSPPELPPVSSLPPISQIQVPPATGIDPSDYESFGSRMAHCMWAKGYEETTLSAYATKTQLMEGIWEAANEGVSHIGTSVAFQTVKGLLELYFPIATVVVEIPEELHNATFLYGLMRKFAIGAYNGVPFGIAFLDCARRQGLNSADFSYLFNLHDGTGIPVNSTYGLDVPAPAPVVVPMVAAKKGPSVGKILSTTVGSIGLVVASTLGFIALANSPSSTNTIDPIAPVTTVPVIAASPSWSHLSLAGCPSSVKGYVSALYNCKGTIKVTLPAAIPSRTVSVSLDFPGSGSFFHGQATIPSGFIGTVTVPITNEDEGSCVVGSYTSNLTVYAGPAYAIVATLISTQVTLQRTCVN
jgi:hypothetical protein